MFSEFSFLFILNLSSEDSKKIHDWRKIRMNNHTIPKKGIRITCIQLHSATNQKEENLKKMIRLADSALAAYPDTDLLLFPELVLTGCECDPEETKAIAEPLNGPSLKTLAAYAREHHVFLVFGFIEEENGTVYNSAALIDWNGTILGQYRKMHLVEEEKFLVEKGNSDYPVFPTDSCN